jgi:hypothetical protein
MNEKMRPEIRAFLEKLLEDKGIKVPDELREAMLADLHQRLQVRFMQIITDKLSTDDLISLDDIALNQGEDKVQVFLREKIKNLDKLFADAMQEFGEAFLKG